MGFRKVMQIAYQPIHCQCNVCVCICALYVQPISYTCSSWEIIVFGTLHTDRFARIYRSTVHLLGSACRGIASAAPPLRPSQWHCFSAWLSCSAAYLARESRQTNDLCRFAGWLIYVIIYRAAITHWLEDWLHWWPSFLCAKIGNRESRNIWTWEPSRRTVLRVFVDEFTRVNGAAYFSSNMSEENSAIAITQTNS